MYKFEFLPYTYTTNFHEKFLFVQCNTALGVMVEMFLVECSFVTYYF